MSHINTTLQIIAAQSAYRRKYEQASNRISRWWYGFMVSCLEHDERATLAEIRRARG